MRSSRKLSVAALVVLAAGLSLTACNTDDVTGSGSADATSTSAPSGQASAPSDGGGSGGGSGGGACRTADLALSTRHGISGEGQEIVEMKNTGSGTCTLHGFPGVDLKGPGSDDAVSAKRSSSDVPSVVLAPGGKTEFTLDYPLNDSGGSGYTFTTMIVTPPNETHAKSLTTSINVPVDNPDEPASGGIVVNAVGAGK